MGSLWSMLMRSEKRNGEVIGNLVRRYATTRHKLACLGVGVVLLAVAGLTGCSLNSKQGEVMTQKETHGCAMKNAQSVTPPGYPYPPEELWCRLLEVIKTPPDELTYHKLGQIFGVEFDEDKMRWYGDKASRKYFLLTKNSIRNVQDFPFHRINLTQGDPDPYAKMPIRHMLFNFYPFDQKDSASEFCINPRFSDLEALRYRYDEFRSNLPQWPDANGIVHYRPYMIKIFVGGPNVESTGTVHLEVLPNGCLVGITYHIYPISF